MGPLVVFAHTVRLKEPYLTIIDIITCTVIECENLWLSTNPSDASRWKVVQSGPWPIFFLSLCLKVTKHLPGWAQINHAF